MAIRSRRGFVDGCAVSFEGQEVLKVKCHFRFALALILAPLGGGASF